MHFHLVNSYQISKQILERGGGGWTIRGVTRGRAEEREEESENKTTRPPILTVNVLRKRKKSRHFVMKGKKGFENSKEN